MKIEHCKKESFALIGKEGSTQDGSGFIQRLWADSNSHFHEVSHLAKRDEQGNILGIWGVMSDYSRSFHPWEENFSQGLYLAGVECDEDAVPPKGWSKWVVPGFEYFRVACDHPNTFQNMLGYLAENKLRLAGAVHDFTDPATQKNYMYFPVKRL